jgi:hypothetical protein
MQNGRKKRGSGMLIKKCWHLINEHKYAF